MEQSDKCWLAQLTSSLSADFKMKLTSCGAAYPSNSKGMPEAHCLDSWESTSSIHKAQ